MISKFISIAILLAAFAALAKAEWGFEGYNNHHEHHGHPSYKFEYGVHDEHTGDIKSQSEHSEGGVVTGTYSLVEPDGTTRVVEYTADDHNGFNAIVKRHGHAHHYSHENEHY